MTKNQKRAAIAAACLLVLGFGGYLWWQNSTPADLPPAKTLAEATERLVAATREAKDEKAMQKVMDKAVEMGSGGMLGVFLRNYAGMTPEQKKAFLDEQIKVPVEHATTGPSSMPSGMGGPEVKRIERRSSSGSDKGFMESMDPALRAQLADYAKDLAARRKELGLPPGPVAIKINVTSGTGQAPKIGFGDGSAK